jgi:nucleolar protein 12
MLPRVLRVVRAKAVKKTERAFAASRADSRSSKQNSSKERIYNPKVTSELSSLKGRASKLLGRAGAAQLNKKGASGANGTVMGKRASGAANGTEIVMKTPESIVFEGYRASSKNGRPKDLKLGGKGGGKKQGKPRTRSTKRASEWKKGAGKK